MGTTTKQYLTATQISGTKYALSATQPGADSATKISVPALTVLAVNRQFSPQNAAGPANATPTVGTAFNGVGWEMNATIVQYGDPGTLSNAVAPVVTVNLTANQAITPTLTAILYLNGAEIGRASQSPALTTSATTVTFTMPATTQAMAASSVFEVALYASNLTNASATTATTISINDGANTAYSGGQTYSIQASRSISDTNTTSDAPTRTTVQARATSEALTTSDSPVRVLHTVRGLTDTTAVSDSTARVYSAVRALSDTKPTTDAVTRSYIGGRQISDIYVTSDVVTRALTFGRFTYEYPPGSSADFPITLGTKHVTGRVLNNDGTVFTAGATVLLIRDSDNAVVQTQTSAGDGSYSFVRDQFDPNTYHVEARETSTTPVQQGSTPSGLVPA